MEVKMDARLRRAAAVWRWAALMLLQYFVAVQSLPNCSFPALYAFGDSLTDVGNSIAAFPAQFAHAELPPNGITFPTHAADRFCDGKLLVDFMAFGVRLSPIYAVLRGTAGVFTYGTNFAAAGSTARNSTVWVKNSGFSTPFSLEVQLQWLHRYKVRLEFYYNQTYMYNQQSLPPLDSLNSSLYIVHAGYQDYFFGLYDKNLTPRQAMDIVGSVVAAIVDLIEGIVAFGAKNLLVVNLPPLGCIPAMLTLYQSPFVKYDGYGCLRDLNKITAAHNKLLGEKLIPLRTKYAADVKLYYGDLHGVFTDILKDPTKYNVTNPLQACCGTGGHYNFNDAVTCGYTGRVGNQAVDLTTSPCENAAKYISWDGIHLSNTFNKAVATAFLTGKHITPKGGFNCVPDFTQWNLPY